MIKKLEIKEVQEADYSDDGQIISFWCVSPSGEKVRLEFRADTLGDFSELLHKTADEANFIRQVDFEEPAPPQSAILVSGFAVGVTEGGGDTVLTFQAPDGLTFNFLFSSNIDETLCDGTTLLEQLADSLSQNCDTKAH